MANQHEIQHISNLSDQHLNDKIARLAKIATFASKLPDSGQKMRTSLNFCQEELHRRNQLLPPKEAECENAGQSQSSCSHVLGAGSEFSLEAPSSQAHSHSEKVEDKPDLTTQTSKAPSSQAHSQSENFEDKPEMSTRVSKTPSSEALSQSKTPEVEQPDLSTRNSANSFQRRLSYLGRGNHHNTRSNGKWLNKGKHDTKALWRQKPFRNSKTSNRDGNEHRSTGGAQKFIDSSRQDGYISRPIPRRFPSLRNLKILQNILQSPSTSNLQSQCSNTDQVDSKGPSEAQMAQLLSSVQVMQQQFQTVQTQLASLESQVTTQIYRLETKVEQIIHGQTVDKRPTVSTSERHDTSDT